MNILSNFTDFYDFCFLNEKNESYAKHVFMRKEEYISKSNITLSIEQCDIFKDILTKTVLNKNWDNGLGNDNNNYYLEVKNFVKNIKKEQYPLDIISVKMYNVKAVIHSGTVLM